MANLKNITELPVAESADSLNLIVNDNGVAKQIAASNFSPKTNFIALENNTYSGEWFVSINGELSPALTYEPVEDYWYIRNPEIYNKAKAIISNGTIPLIRTWDGDIFASDVTVEIQIPSNWEISSSNIILISDKWICG
jgi:hypothetical protein